MEKNAVSIRQLKTPAWLAGGALTAGGLGYLATRDRRSTWSKQNMGQKLAPGIYMGSRKVRGAPIGKHQFIMMIPQNPEIFPPGSLKDLGAGNKGILVGAYRRASTVVDGDRLRYSRNDKYDIKAARSYFTGENDATWSTELLPTTLNKDIDQSIQDVIARGKAYRINERYNKEVAYPSIVANALSKGVNSNSFAQNIAAGAGVKQIGTFAGFDPGKELTIGEQMFKKEGPQLQEQAEAIFAEKPDDPASLLGLDKQAFMKGYLGKEAGVVGDIAWEGSKIVPLYGAIPSAIDVVRHTAKGEYGSAALNLLGAGFALAPEFGGTIGSAAISGTKAFIILRAANQARKVGKLKKAWEATKRANKAVWAKNRAIRAALPTAKPLGKIMTGLGRGMGTAVGGRYTPWGRAIISKPELAYNVGRRGALGLWAGGQTLEASRTVGEERKKQAIFEALWRQRQMQQQGIMQ